MSSCDFQLCDDISCNIYCATGVFYVSLDTFRNMLQFETTEISNNVLPSSALTDICANITYHLNSSLLPVMNCAHTMMDSSHSEGIIFNSTIRESNLLKHDYIYYKGQKILGNPEIGASIINNKKYFLDTIEYNGWMHKNTIETICINADNNGNGLVNTENIVDSNNITKRILQQIEYYDPSRLYVSDPSQNSHIQNTTEKQSVPLIEGDTINYLFILNNISDNSQRKYRIKLYLTNNTSYINTIPTYTISNTIYYTNIYSVGVPQVTS